MQKGTAKEIKRGNYYYFALPIEEETKDNLFESLNNIKLAIYSLQELSQKLNLRSMSISRTSKINHIAWKDIKLIFDLVFANSLTVIIFCNDRREFYQIFFSNTSS